MIIHLKFEILTHHVSQEGSHFNLHMFGDGTDIKVVN